MQSTPSTGYVSADPNVTPVPKPIISAFRGFFAWIKGRCAKSICVGRSPRSDPSVLLFIRRLLVPAFSFYKTEAYRLARSRNSITDIIPESILTKAPSAELRPDQKDQDSLPPYEVLDAILYCYIEKGLSRNEIVAKLGPRADAGLIAEVIRKVDHNEYKRRQTPPILRVTEKAWFGRRMPITNRFSG